MEEPANDSSGERRWIVLTGDGRYVTLGRHSDPSTEEIDRAEEGLRQQGLAGWLAVMQGNPHAGAVPHLMEVRPLADPAGSFESATAACVRDILMKRQDAGLKRRSRLGEVTQSKLKPDRL